MINIKGFQDLVDSEKIKSDVRFATLIEKLDTIIQLLKDKK